MARTISVVRDPSFGDRVEKLAFRNIVWLIESDTNRVAAARAMHHAEEWPHLSITMFRRIGDSKGDWLVLLDQIDLHHGRPGQHWTFDTLEVIGAETGDEPRAALEERGFTTGRPTDTGFIASSPRDG